MSDNKEVEDMEDADDGSDRSSDRPATHFRATSAVAAARKTMPTFTHEPEPTTSAASTSAAQRIQTTPTTSVNNQSTAATASTPSPYVRQFPDGYTGILEVWIRSADREKLPNITMQRFLNERFKSIASIIPHRDKLAVIFGDRIEANTLASQEIFLGTSATIPSKCIVDVDCAIRTDELTGMCDLNELVKDGLGVFGSAHLRPCRILNAVQLSRTGENNVRVGTNTVKVTFEGNLVPKYVAIDKLRIPTRLFHKSPMFCEVCQTHGHTNKFCRRKKICARCNDNHGTNECTNPAVNKQLCPRCAKEHPNSRSACPYFQKVAKDYKAAQIASSNQRYQQTLTRLRDLDANGTLPQQAPALDNANFPPLRNTYASLAAQNIDDDDDEGSIDYNQPPTPHSTPPPLSKSTPPPPSHSFPPPPRNPYASRPRGRSSKRRRDGSFSVSRQPEEEQMNHQPAANHHQEPQRRQQPTPRQASVSSRAAPRREQHPNLRGNPQSTALKTIIITAARNAEINELWLAILEAIIDPLLEAILPQASSIIAALAPAVYKKSPAC